MTYGEIIYMCLDEIKAMSDDSYVTEDHIFFLVSKYRSFLLRQKYEKTNMPVAKSNYQQFTAYAGAGASVPSIMDIAKPIVYIENWSQDKGTYLEYLTYVPYHRFQFVGNNRHLSKIKYCTVDLHNAFKIKASQSEEDKSIQPISDSTPIHFHAVFEDFRDVQAINLEDKCPIEDDLVAGVIELVVKDILGIAYRPQDKTNNSNDDLGSVGLMSGNPKNSR